MNYSFVFPISHQNVITCAASEINFRSDDVTKPSYFSTQPYLTENITILLGDDFVWIHMMWIVQI